MKSLPWILVCLLIGLVVWMRCNPHDPSTVYIKGDTVRIRDTIRDTIPRPVKETLKRTDTVYLPNNNGTEVIMKLSHYELLFPVAALLPLTDDETPLEPVYPYPVYENEELSALLSSSEWSGEEVIAPVLETISPKTSTRSTKSKKTTVL